MATSPRKAVSEAAALLGRKGGKRRAEKLGAKRLKEIATEMSEKAREWRLDHPEETRRIARRAALEKARKWRLARRAALARHGDKPKGKPKR